MACPPTHGESGDGAIFGAGFDAVFFLDHREDGFHEVEAEFFGVVDRASVAEGTGNGVAVEHDDDHRDGFVASDEVVEDPVGFAVGGPGGKSVAMAVLEDEEWIFLAGVFVSGWGVDLQFSETVDRI